MENLKHNFGGYELFVLDNEYMGKKTEKLLILPKGFKGDAQMAQKAALDINAIDDSTAIELYVILKSDNGLSDIIPMWEFEDFLSPITIHCPPPTNGLFIDRGSSI